MGVRGQERLAREIRRAVQGNRLERTVVLRRRNDLGLAVHGRCRREHDARDRGRPARFQDSMCRDDVLIDRGLRPSTVQADIRVCGKVINDIGPPENRTQVAPEEIAFHERRPRPDGLREVGALPGFQMIDRNDLGLTHERVRDVAADEPRTAGDDDFGSGHGSPSTQLVTTYQRSFGVRRRSANASTAFARCDTAFFSPTVISAIVFFAPTASKIGSKPNHPLPPFEAVIDPPHSPRKTSWSSAIRRRNTVSNRAARFRPPCSNFRMPAQQRRLHTYDEYTPGKPPNSSMNHPESSMR